MAELFLLVLVYSWFFFFLIRKINTSVLKIQIQHLARASLLYHYNAF